MNYFYNYRGLFQHKTYPEVPKGITVMAITTLAIACSLNGHNIWKRALRHFERNKMKDCYISLFLT